jgi:hypothetical protein
MCSSNLKIYNNFFADKIADSNKLSQTDTNNNQTNNALKNNSKHQTSSELNNNNLSKVNSNQVGISESSKN